MVYKMAYNRNNVTSEVVALLCKKAVVIEIPLQIIIHIYERYKQQRDKCN